MSAEVQVTMARNTIPDWEPEFLTSADADHNKRVVQWSMSYGMRMRAGKRISDFGLGAAGAGMALASVAFALVMMKADITDPNVGGAEYLLLFTRPLHAPGTPSAQVATRAVESNIDFTATGSIKPPRAADKAGDQLKSKVTEVMLKEYVLRSVRGGLATINGPNGRFIVETGSLMPNGDEVLSIDRRAGRWVVVTSGGIIEDR